MDPVDPQPPCEPSGPFGVPELVVGLGTTAPSFGPAPSDDGLTLFFSSVVADVDEDIFFATRTSRENQFSSARRVAGVNGVSEEGTPFLSADGSSLISSRPAPMTTRPAGATCGSPIAPAVTRSRRPASLPG